MPNYTLGRGKLYFKKDGTNGFLDLGNCPDFKINVDSETLEHFSSQEGLKKKDDEVVIEQSVMANFILDDPTIENLELFFMSSAAASNDQAADSLSAENVTVYLDKWVDIGYVNLSNVVVKDSGSVTYILDTDYKIDLKRGLIMAISTGSISDAETVLIDADYAATPMSDIHAATTTTVKGKLLFVGNPARGLIVDFEGYVSLKPSGDMGLISEEWAQMGFEAEFLDHTDYTGLAKLTKRGLVT